MDNKKKDEGRQSHYVTGDVIFGADRRHDVNTAARRLAGQFWAAEDGRVSDLDQELSFPL